MKLSLFEIAEMCGGKLFGDGSTTIDKFITDSRQAGQGLMFVPIKGEKVDGHSFIPQIFEGGCSATFSEIELENPQGYYILVENSISALQAVAEKYREKFDIPIIGITGSVGKTTTKEMVALAIESKLKTHKTAGNANSQVGLPLTVLGISDDDQCAILEMGMSIPGEMGRISKTAKVGLGIITNIGVSHIEFHGTRENILKEKIQLADYLNGGKLFVNGDDNLLSQLETCEKYQIIKFGVNENCDYCAIDIIENESFTRFTLIRSGESYPVFLPTLGIHNVRNALVAAAAAEAVGIDISDAISAIGRYIPPNMRGQIKSLGGITVIDDSYNSSPDSCIASLGILKSMKGRKIAVLADMLELGDYSQKGHTDVGLYAKEIGADVLIAIGEESKYIAHGFGKEAKHFMDNQSAWEYLSGILTDGDCLLIKGSRGMKTDEIVKLIEEKFA